ncbi:MAG TPA: urease subunit beta [Porticoccaceae bacterium]|nr:urease subunit beta [Porticoccaceae bacterium]
MIVGEIEAVEGSVKLNEDRVTQSITVTNSGDRPVQVGSHYHFFESNSALKFERDSCRGFRLNIAAGTAIRFEPGQDRTVELVAIGGNRRIYGFNGKVMGPLGEVGTT